MPGPLTMWQTEGEEGYDEADIDWTFQALLESLIRKHEEEDDESILASSSATPPPKPALYTYGGPVHAGHRNRSRAWQRRPRAVSPLP